MMCNLAEAQARILANQFDYEAHIIRYHITKDPSHFLHLSTLFLVKPQDWLTYISNDNDQDKAKLFVDALNDFKDVSLYIALFHYLLACGSEIKDLRPEYHQMIQSLEFDYKNSYCLFEEIIQAEIEFIESLEGIEATLEIGYLRDLILSRLIIPNSRLDDYFNLYSAFESHFNPLDYSLVMRSASAIISGTKKDCFKRDEFEGMIRGNTSADGCLDIYLEYIKYDRSNLNHGNSPSNEISVRAVTTLYERAILTESTNPIIWNAYLSFLIINHPDSIEQVVDRALKASVDCMMDSRLWCHKMQVSLGNVDLYFDKAVHFVSFRGDVESICLLLETRLSIAKADFILDETSIDDDSIKSIRGVYKKLLEVRKEKVKVHDYGLDIQMANIEAFSLHDIEAAHAIFKGISRRSNTSKVWIAWTDLSIRVKDLQKARLTFEDAVRVVTTETSVICRRWQDFENFYGSWDDVRRTNALIFECMLEINKLPPIPQVELDPCVTPSYDGDINPSKRKLDGIICESLNEDQNSVLKKSKVDHLIKNDCGKAILGIDSYKVIENSSAGQMIYVSNLPSTITVDRLIKGCMKYGRVIDCFLQPNKESGEIEGFVEYLSTDSVRQLISNNVFVDETLIQCTRCRPATLKWSFGDIESKSTVFVSNIEQGVNKMELRELFVVFGKIKDIRLMIKPGRVFAYIQFINDADALASCILDQHDVHGKIISVAISNPAKKKKIVVDRTQLFITNLARSLAEPDLQGLFAECGEIENIRLIRSESGPKGYAFVKFKDVGGAMAALNLNGTTLDNRVIAITVSDPNMQKNKNEKFKVKGVVNESVEISANSFVPRTTMGRSKPRNVVSSSTGSGVQAGVHKVVVDGKPKTSKTQDDFRAMMISQE